MKSAASGRLRIGMFYWIFVKPFLLEPEKLTTESFNRHSQLLRTTTDSMVRTVKRENYCNESSPNRRFTHKKSPTGH